MNNDNEITTDYTLYDLKKFIACSFVDTIITPAAEYVGSCIEYYSKKSILLLYESINDYLKSDESLHECINNFKSFIIDLKSQGSNKDNELATFFKGIEIQHEFIEISSDSLNTVSNINIQVENTINLTASNSSKTRITFRDFVLNIFIPIITCVMPMIQNGYIADVNSHKAETQSDNLSQDEYNKRANEFFEKFYTSANSEFFSKEFSLYRQSQYLSVVSPSDIENSDCSESLD